MLFGIDLGSDAYLGASGRREKSTALYSKFFQRLLLNVLWDSVSLQDKRLYGGILKLFRLTMSLVSFLEFMYLSKEAKVIRKKTKQNISGSSK